MWAGAMIALYGGIIAFISLIFSYINHAMPDMALGYYADPYSGISYQMASLIVLAPLFLILMRVIRRNIAHDASRGEVWVRRWALFLTLFVAGATIAIDLIVLLTTFLSGEELSARFLLKVLVVLLVAGGGFLHFMADLHGYWTKNAQYARYINWAVAVLVAASIIAGFFIVGTPSEARQTRLDQTRLNDLQSLQSQVVYIYQQKSRLPAMLSELNDELSYYTVPVDPETNQPYGYSVTGPLMFELCADFTTAGGADQYGRSIAMPEFGVKGDKWEHGVGRTCFERTIDPELYPPYPKPVR